MLKIRRGAKPQRTRANCTEYCYAQNQKGSKTAVAEYCLAELYCYAQNQKGSKTCRLLCNHTHCIAMLKIRRGAKLIAIWALVSTVLLCSKSEGEQNGE